MVCFCWAFSKRLVSVRNRLWCNILRCLNRVGFDCWRELYLFSFVNWNMFYFIKKLESRLIYSQSIKNKLERGKKTSSVSSVILFHCQKKTKNLNYNIVRVGKKIISCSTCSLVVFPPSVFFSSNKYLNTLTGKK